MPKRNVLHSLLMLLLVEFTILIHAPYAKARTETNSLLPNEWIQDLDDSVNPTLRWMFYKEQADKYFNEKDYVGAIRSYSKAIEIYPFTVLFYNRGISYFNLKKYSDANNDLTKAIGFDSSRAEYYLARGHSRLKLNDYYGAKDDYTKSLDLDYKIADAHAFKGVTYQKLNIMVGACDSWREAKLLGHKEATKWYQDSACEKWFSGKPPTCIGLDRELALGEFFICQDSDGDSSFSIPSANTNPSLQEVLSDTPFAW